MTPVFNALMFLEYKTILLFCFMASFLFIGAYWTASFARKRKLAVCRDYGDALFPITAGCGFLVFSVILEDLKYFGVVSAVKKDTVSFIGGFVIFILLIFHSFYAAWTYYKNDCKRALFVFFSRVLFVTPLALLLYIGFVTLIKMAKFILFPPTEDIGFIYIKFVLSTFIFALVFIIVRLFARLLFDFASVRRFSNPFKYFLSSNSRPWRRR